MSKLTEAQIKKQMQHIEGWDYGDNAIHTTIEFSDFKDCFTVMTRIAFEAENLNHHPDWSNVYNKLSITLSSHEEGGLTEKDFQLAQIIDSIVS